MTTARVSPSHEWNRYQWASIALPLDEKDGPRWYAVEWVGDQGRGNRSHPIVAAELGEERAGASGFSGFGHSAGENHWARGYQL